MIPKSEGMMDLYDRIVPAHVFEPAGFGQKPGSTRSGLQSFSLALLQHHACGKHEYAAASVGDVHRTFVEKNPGVTPSLKTLADFFKFMTADTLATMASKSRYVFFGEATEHMVAFIPAGWIVIERFVGKTCGLRMHAKQNLTFFNSKDGTGLFGEELRRASKQLWPLHALCFGKGLLGSARQQHIKIKRHDIHSRQKKWSQEFQWPYYVDESVLTLKDSWATLLKMEAAVQVLPPQETAKMQEMLGAM